jgi:hypothetical protein
MSFFVGAEGNGEGTRGRESERGGKREGERGERESEI